MGEFIRESIDEWLRRRKEAGPTEKGAEKAADKGGSEKGQTESSHQQP